MLNLKKYNGRERGKWEMLETKVGHSVVISAGEMTLKVSDLSRQLGGLAMDNPNVALMADAPSILSYACSLEGTIQTLLRRCECEERSCDTCKLLDDAIDGDPVELEPLRAWELYSSMPGWVDAAKAMEGALVLAKKLALKIAKSGMAVDHVLEEVWCGKGSPFNAVHAVYGEFGTGDTEPRVHAQIEVQKFLKHEGYED